MLDYFDTEFFLNQTPEVKFMTDLVAGWGEPMITSFAPRSLPARLSDLGFEVIEDLDRAEQSRRYFDARSDGLVPDDIAHSIAIRAV